MILPVRVGELPSHKLRWVANPLSDQAKHLKDVSNDLADTSHGVADAKLDIKPARYPVGL